MNTANKILEKVQERVDDFKAKMESIDFDKVQEKVDDFKAKMEAFDLQYALGRNEAKDAFDREWRNFSRYVEEQGNKIRQQGFFSGHALDALDKTLPELQAILKETIPAKETAAQLWRERLLRAVYEMEFIIRDLYPNLQPEGRDTFSRLRIDLELLRARILMAPWEDWGKFANEVNAVNTSIEAALLWRKEQKEMLKKRLEGFGQEVSELFAKMKGRVEGMFN